MIDISIPGNHLATIVMDIAAVLILIGVLYYTKLYRKRDRLDDRLYFWMVVITMIVAISDAIVYIVDGSKIPGAFLLNVLGDNVFYIAFEILAFLLFTYLDLRNHKDVKITEKRWVLYSIPAVISIIMTLANNFIHFIYWVDPATNTYNQSGLHNIIYVAPLLYSILALVVVWNINKKVIWLFVLLFFVRIVFGNIIADVSTTGIVMSTVLVFVHIHQMRLPFYEEVWSK